MPIVRLDDKNKNEQKSGNSVNAPVKKINPALKEELENKKIKEKNEAQRKKEKRKFIILYIISFIFFLGLALLITALINWGVSGEFTI